MTILILELYDFKSVSTALPSQRTKPLYQFLTITFLLQTTIPPNFSRIKAYSDVEKAFKTVFDADLLRIEDSSKTRDNQEASDFVDSFSGDAGSLGDSSQEPQSVMQWTSGEHAIQG